MSLAVSKVFPMFLAVSKVLLPLPGGGMEGKERNGSIAYWCVSFWTTVRTVIILLKAYYKSRDLWTLIFTTTPVVSVLLLSPWNRWRNRGSRHGKQLLQNLFGAELAFSLLSLTVQRHTLTFWSLLSFKTSWSGIDHRPPPTGSQELYHWGRAAGRAGELRPQLIYLGVLRTEHDFPAFGGERTWRTIL